MRRHFLTFILSCAVLALGQETSTAHPPADASDSKNRLFADLVQNVQKNAGWARWIYAIYERILLVGISEPIEPPQMQPPCEMAVPVDSKIEHFLGSAFTQADERAVAYGNLYRTAECCASPLCF